MPFYTENADFSNLDSGQNWDGFDKVFEGIDTGGEVHFADGD